MGKNKRKSRPEFIIFNKETDAVKETVHSTYAAKQRTLFHNNLAYEQMRGTPYKWKKALVH